MVTAGGQKEGQELRRKSGKMVDPWDWLRWSGTTALLTSPSPGQLGS